MAWFYAAVNGLLWILGLYGLSLHDALTIFLKTARTLAEKTATKVDDVVVKLAQAAIDNPDVMAFISMIVHAPEVQTNKDGARDNAILAILHNFQGGAFLKYFINLVGDESRAKEGVLALARIALTLLGKRY